MHSPARFIITPAESRYNNKKKIGDKELVLNTRLEDHKFVSREAVVVAVPLLFETELKVGDKIIVHHNIFRRFYDVRGIEKNGGSFLTEDLYLCDLDQIYMYNRGDGWNATKDYCFVKPVFKRKEMLLTEEKEEPNVGILKHSNSSLEALGFNEGDTIGFTQDSEYEFVIEGERLYRMRTKSIIINYGQQGDKEEYNPSWSNSGGGINKSS